MTSEANGKRVRGSVLRRIAIRAVLVVGAVLAAEVVLRAYFYQESLGPTLALQRLWRPVRTKLMEVAGLRRPSAIWQADPELGYTHRPGSEAVHAEHTFRVTYHIGSDGGRLMPSPENPLGRVVFLGGSYTFGHGVEDDETFPYLLARDYWPRWQVANRSAMGWGTVHAYLVLKRELERDDPPAMFVYVMIPHHVGRNYLRRSWMAVAARQKWGHPHFEIVDGELRHMGVVGPEASLPDGPEVAEKEFQLTSAFLGEMARLCAARDVSFALVLLRRDWPPRVVEAILEHGIRFVDLSQLPIEGIDGDPHPNPDDHRRIAAAIAESFLTDVLEDRAARQ